MSAPSHALSLAQEVTGPDVSSIVTEHDAPFDNIYSERQKRLLLTTLYAHWSGPPPEEDGLPRTFVAMANVGVFGTATDPPVVPDVMVSLDVAFGADVLAKENRAYFMWVFGRSPDLVIEVVSNREGEELAGKKRKYRHLHVPSYVVWDPAGHLGETAVHAFELHGGLYVEKHDAFFDALGLGLAPWEGGFEGCTSRWLRWVDAEGKLLPTGTERALQERERADRLAEKLRALGIDPDAS